ncbi:pseudouridine synthase [Candidatus Aerophobetes bacterium]|uniref:Pseudouridine synthase n=1 Tax=Aerophobetes bacterium TaxID=2030807 RepID=A0A2A4X0P4_UNCAE|nr:MAG: pseudouridine synthase [Candidatus Aerophobetes bacterium]
MAPLRLSKFLSRAGVTSRRKAEELIESGSVTVNGQRVTVPQHGVNPEKDRICVEDEPVKLEKSRVVYMLNKPKGYECSAIRHGRKRIVLDLFPHSALRLFTVGRLDRDTSGLLLVTNDGHFANSVIHPSSNLTREYLIKTKEEISSFHLKVISEGCFVENGYVRPIKVTKVRKGTLKIVVSEGKKREVRLLVKNADLSLLSLHRIRLGGLVLGTLPPGQTKTLTESEKQAIFS